MLLFLLACICGDITVRESVAVDGEYIVECTE